MLQAHHSWCICFYRGTLQSVLNYVAVFENKDKIVIVMEYASKGELYDYISERRRLTERETRHFFRQIVSAVHYCHKVLYMLPFHLISLSCLVSYFNKAQHINTAALCACCLQHLHVQEQSLDD